MSIVFPPSPISIPYVSGNWYGSANTSQTASGVVAAAARMYAHPLEVYRAATFDQLGLRVITPGVGSVAKMAIYAADGTNGRPGTRIGQTAEGSTVITTSNLTLALTADVTLNPGLYWLAQIHDWSTTAPVCTTTASVTHWRRHLGASTADTAITPSGGWVYADATYATAFPASFGAATEVTGSTGNPAVMAIRAK